VNGSLHPPRHICLAAGAHVSASQPPEATAPEPGIVRPHCQRNVMAVVMATETATPRSEMAADWPPDLLGLSWPMARR
jgi:hypothetical protein